MIGVADLERSVSFYRDVIGLDAADPVDWSGRALERHMQLAPGTSVRAVVLSAGDSPVGRIILLDFGAEATPIRAAQERSFLGLLNLNFYTRDIAASFRELVAAGCEPWTDPVPYEVGDGEGTPTEVILEGPDGVLINLVQPEGEPGSPVAEIRAYLDSRGTTATGHTEVVTTAHAVRSIDEALGFYVDVLGFEVWLDMEFAHVEGNRLLSLPDDARSRITFVKGHHAYGKIALIEGLDYEPVDLVPRAEPPAIGYLAMCFELDDLDGTLARMNARGGNVWTAPVELELPSFGLRRAAVVRTPGSGALTQLIEANETD